jgi:hypothetical protein
MPDLMPATYIDGLRAALAACHKKRERFLKDRREAIAEKDATSQSYATIETLAVWMCIEEIQALIDREIPDA